MLLLQLVKYFPATHYEAASESNFRQQTNDTCVVGGTVRSYSYQVIAMTSDFFFHSSVISDFKIMDMHYFIEEKLSSNWKITHVQWRKLGQHRKAQRKIKITNNPTIYSSYFFCPYYTGKLLYIAKVHICIYVYIHINVILAYSQPLSPSNHEHFCVRNDHLGCHCTENPQFT